jgi:hypothetical protein
LKKVLRAAGSKGSKNGEAPVVDDPFLKTLKISHTLKISPCANEGSSDRIKENYRHKR